MHSGSARSVVALALQEDAPWGDVTSDALLSAGATASGTVVAREAGTMAAHEVLHEAFHQVGGCRVDVLIGDGARFVAGAVLARVEGNARSVLRAERVALNLAQRLCGIATLTAAYVDAVAHTSARIADTRKTTPGLRRLEKHAVRCGGGANHRFSLSDAVLVKDNHLAALLQDGGDVTTALVAARARIPHTTSIEVEVDTLAQIEPVLASGVVDTIMLDNFNLEGLRAGVRQVAGRASVEASGGVSLATVAAIAETGVDIISVGALTHGARALDLGLDLQVQG